MSNPAISGEPIDAMLVINQDASINVITSLCQQHKLLVLLILSTHHLFASERETLQSLPGVKRVIFREFGKLLSDAEMQNCDDRATQKLLTQYPQTLPMDYVRRHMAASTYSKNALIGAKISASFTIKQTFYTPAIGIDDKFWATFSRSTKLGTTKKRGGWLREIMQKLKNTASLVSKKKIVIFETGDKQVFMLADTTRLHPLPPGTGTEVSVSCLASLWSFNNSMEAYRSLIFTHAASGKATVVATTIHQYDARVDTLDFPIEIFIDGYHPSNYPRSYIDSYARGNFIVRDMFDAKWFSQYGKSIRSPYGFLQPVMMKAPTSFPSGIQTIYLMLNHAGDWSALINRSDTDILVEIFAEIARENPMVTMVIRPHPTMASMEHEGEGSIQRLVDYVRSTRLANLSISKNTLDADIVSADVIISEYSDVILDGFKTGKLGVIANCTGRRNFMQDYSDLGFATASNPEEIATVVGDVLKDTEKYLHLQAAAAEKYNIMLQNFLRK